MTNEEIQSAIINRPDFCCGDPATCQGTIGDKCSLMKIYEADMKEQHDV